MDEVSVTVTGRLAGTAVKWCAPAKAPARLVRPREPKVETEASLSAFGTPWGSP